MRGYSEPGLKLHRCKLHVAALVNFTKNFVAFERRASGAFEITFERHGDGPVQTPELVDDADQVLFHRIAPDHFRTALERATSLRLVSSVSCRTGRQSDRQDNARATSEICPAIRTDRTSKSIAAGRARGDTETGRQASEVSMSATADP